MKVDLFILQMKMLKQLEESKEDLEKEIDDICYRYGGVHAIQYDKTPSNTNEYAINQQKHILSEMLVEPQAQLDKTIYAINNLEPIVNDNLSRLPKEINKAVKMIFWENKTYHDVGIEIGYSDHGLWKRIRKEINKL